MSSVHAYVWGRGCGMYYVAAVLRGGMLLRFVVQLQRGAQLGTVVAGLLAVIPVGLHPTVAWIDMHRACLQPAA
jgi:hypothetical protein